MHAAPSVHLFLHLRTALVCKAQIRVSSLPTALATRVIVQQEPRSRMAPTARWLFLPLMINLPVRRAMAQASVLLVYARVETCSVALLASETRLLGLALTLRLQANVRCTAGAMLVMGIACIWMPLLLTARPAMVVCAMEAFAMQMPSTNLATGSLKTLFWPL